MVCQDVGVAWHLPMLMSRIEGIPSPSASRIQGQTKNACHVNSDLFGFASSIAFPSASARCGWEDLRN
jgi:hypothetical protein